MRTILLGKPIGSQEALAAGLVCDVFEDDKVLDGALEAAVTMVQRPPMAMQMAKEAILRGSYPFSQPRYESFPLFGLCFSVLRTHPASKDLPPEAISNLAS